MSQKPIPPPQTGPAMPWKDRLDMTAKNLHKFKPLPTPPAGFDPHKATNEELIKAGLPCRPDQKNQPGLYAKWKGIVSRRVTHVPSRFHPITQPRDPRPRDIKVVELGAGPNSTSGNWSGAVSTDLGPGESFNHVSGSWTVPNAYPPDSAKLTDTTWKDGTYICVSWVGIDGWGSGDVLQGGTGSRCVVWGGNIISQSAFAWYEWYPYSWITFSDFSVKPGDTVNCLVKGGAGAGSTDGWVWLHNTSNDQYTSVSFTAPPGTKLVGNCAEWIMEDPSVGGAEAPFPDYGAEFFYDCRAGSSNGTEKNLSTAFLVDCVQGSARLSTAVSEGGKVLMTYAGDSGP